MSAEARPDLNQLSRRYRPALMSYFLRRVGNHADAEDLTQEVFVRLANADAGEMRAVDAYLFQTAANLLRDRSRRDKVRFDYLAAQLAMEDAELEPIDPPRVLAGRRSLTSLAAASPFSAPVLTSATLLRPARLSSPITRITRP